MCTLDAAKSAKIRSAFLFHLALLMYWSLKWVDILGSAHFSARSFRLAAFVLLPTCLHLVFRFPVLWIPRKRMSQEPPLTLCWLSQMRSTSGLCQSRLAPFRLARQSHVRRMQMMRMWARCPQIWFQQATTASLSRYAACLLFSSLTLALPSVMLGRVLAGHLLATLLFCDGIVCCRFTARCRMSVSHPLLPQRSWVVWCCKPCSDRFARLCGYLAGYQQSQLLNRLLAMTCMHLHACTMYPPLE
jgi:hypothetical protein